LKLRTLKTYKASNADGSEIVELGALHREQITHKDLLEIKQSFPNCKIVVTYTWQSETGKTLPAYGDYFRHFVHNGTECIELMEQANTGECIINMADVIRIDVYASHKFDN
jgi:hypothetical protein